MAGKRKPVPGDGDRMTISGTVAEMNNLRAWAAEQDMPVSRFIHAAAAYFHEKGNRNEQLDLMGEIQRLQRMIEPLAHADDSRQKQDTDNPQIDRMAEQINDLANEIALISRELPHRDREEGGVYALPSLEAVLRLCAMLQNLSENRSFHSVLDEAMKRTAGWHPRN